MPHNQAFITKMLLTSIYFHFKSWQNLKDQQHLLQNNVVAQTLPPPPPEFAQHNHHLQNTLVSIVGALHKLNWLCKNSCEFYVHKSAFYMLVLIV